MDNICNYSAEWQPYIGDYDKFEYDIRLSDGRTITNCYPNAGKFNSFKKGTTLQLFPESMISEIRFTPKSEQVLYINPNSLYTSKITPHT